MNSQPKNCFYFVSDSCENIFSEGIKDIFISQGNKLMKSDNRVIWKRYINGVPYDSSTTS